MRVDDGFGNVRLGGEHGWLVWRDGFAEGVCTSYLVEWYYDDGKNLEPLQPLGLEILMKDAAGTRMGWQVHTPADASNPLIVKSDLEDLFVLPPEEQHGYIQFTLGSQSRASDQDFEDTDVPAVWETTMAAITLQ